MFVHPAICKWEKMVPSYFLTNTVAAIQQIVGKNGSYFDPCYLEIKKCSSQLLGARKKIMTSI